MLKSRGIASVSFLREYLTTRALKSEMEIEMGKLLALSGVWLSVLVLASASGATWYVDGSVSQSGDGRNWQTAFKTIQGGIDAAFTGNTVVVAPGKYVENVHFDGKNIVLRSTDPLDPGVVQSTIIDGSQLNPVVTFSGTEDETCVLAGFTIQNGRGLYDGKYGGGIYGGGVYEARTLATIRSNIIAQNKVPST
jgi:hypothetical protein